MVTHENSSAISNGTFFAVVWCLFKLLGMYKITIPPTKITNPPKFLSHPKKGVGGSLGGRHSEHNGAVSKQCGNVLSRMAVHCQRSSKVPLQQDECCV